MKKISVFFFFLLFICGIYVYAQEVALIVSSDLKVYDICRNSLKEKVKFPLKEYFAHGDVDNIEEAIADIKRQKVDLVCVVGAKAAQVARDEIEDIPVVFTLVVNPSQYNLRDTNICGVRADISPDVVFKYLKELDLGIEKIGVIYSKRNSNVVEEAKRSAYESGFEVVAEKVESLREVASKLKDIQNRIDAFWVIPDPFIANSAAFERLLLISVSRKIPLVVPAAAFVRKGGLIGIDVDYKDLGEQTAEIINSILDKESSPESIGIQYPREHRLIINSKMADKLNISIPASLLEKAYTVVK